MMNDTNESLILQLCCDYLEGKDKEIAKKLQSKYKLERLQSDYPKLKQIINEHLNKSKPKQKSNYSETSENRNAFRTFKNGQASKINCHKCNKFGHIAKNCPESNNFNSTNNKRGHDSESRSRNKCYNCSKVGHNAADCPEEQTESRFGNLTCHTCNKVGHISRNCPEKQLSCFKCNKSGHLKKDCPDFKCFNCNQAGHIASNCNSSNKSQDVEDENVEMQSPSQDEEDQEDSDVEAASNSVDNESDD